MNPPRDDGVTTCLACAQPITHRRGRQRYCSAACRQAAYRRRQPSLPLLPPPPARPRRVSSVYACDECDCRYAGVQWCDDCNRPCRRIGTGGQCPECDHPITIDELLTAVPS
ncbi:MAG: hypothetical protein QOJ32_552 [Frankiaceae bacterium]|jgi:hypothetical protein|nr:hypothetical protein [Frankiaceae bacterium]MDQ1633743.1 hypothetical protein [Frankiaceae bacterium]